MASTSFDVGGKEMMYGFVVVAWLTLGTGGHMIPFASMEACKTAMSEYSNLVQSRVIKCVSTGATKEK
jgi:hypothetical protein